ncbi:MAG: hypothetical protein M1819_006408 [Sarea resinae]|nr:MAG: hypothetical protein M1819_006408 [Sarea resinae]
MASCRVLSPIASTKESFMSAPEKGRAPRDAASNFPKMSSSTSLAKKSGSLAILCTGASTLGSSQLHCLPTLDDGLCGHLIRASASPELRILGKGLPVDQSRRRFEYAITTFAALDDPEKRYWRLREPPAKSETETANNTSANVTKVPEKYSALSSLLPSDTHETTHGPTTEICSSKTDQLWNIQPKGSSVHKCYPYLSDPP